MFQTWNGRAGHYGLLVMVWAGLVLPNLGAPSLWDIDEGNNAEASREMLERGDWIVPTFNYQLRVDKPALLYWLQMGAYRTFGLGELAARLPSALAALGTILLVHELGLLMFGASAGLLAGLILASTTGFSASAHFANPDALLNLFTVLTFFFFWRSLVVAGRGWFALAGISSGLAVLAKGPVGLVLPAAITFLFLLWSRRWRILLDRRLLLGSLVFGLVALPWYIWVGAETKADFLRGFLLKHNVGRYLSPMENHNGPVYYYFPVLILGFAPWSIFLFITIWHAVKGLQKSSQKEDTEGSKGNPKLSFQFLACWIVVYLLFFSLAGTKLPNYILPVYAPLALLTGSWLDRWRRGEVPLPAWVLKVSLACLFVMGTGTVLGFLLAGGAIETSVMRGRSLPGLAIWASLGLAPIAGALLGWWCLSRNNRTGLLVTVSAAALVFVAGLAGGGSVALDHHKAPRQLAKLLPEDHLQHEVRLSCFQYFQPSLVFYCRREVSRLDDEEQTLAFLRYPAPVFLFLPAQVWEPLRNKAGSACQVLGSQRDLYRNQEIVVVTNGYQSPLPSPLSVSLLP